MLALQEKSVYACETVAYTQRDYQQTSCQTSHYHGANLITEWHTMMWSSTNRWIIGCCSCLDLFGFFSTFFKIGGCQRKSRIQILRKKIEVYGAHTHRDLFNRIWYLFDFVPLDVAMENHWY